MDTFSKHVGLLVGGKGIKVASPTSTAAVTLTANEIHVEVVLPATGDGDVNLPLPSEAAGQLFCIYTPKDGAGGTATVMAPDLDLTYTAIGTQMTGGDGYNLLYCNGIRYIAFASAAT